MWPTDCISSDVALADSKSIHMIEPIFITTKVRYSKFSCAYPEMCCPEHSPGANHWWHPFVAARYARPF